MSFFFNVLKYIAFTFADLIHNFVVGCDMVATGLSGLLGLTPYGKVHLCLFISVTAVGLCGLIALLQAVTHVNQTLFFK